MFLWSDVDWCYKFAVQNSGAAFSQRYDDCTTFLLSALNSGNFFVVQNFANFVWWDSRCKTLKLIFHLCENFKGMFYNFALGCPFESLSRLNVFSTSKNLWNMAYNHLPRLQEKDWLRRHLHAGMLVLRGQVVNALTLTKTAFYIRCTRLRMR